MRNFTKKKFLIFLCIFSVLILGSLVITSGIGLLLQKFWAYRLTQALLIINIITAPLFLLFPEFEVQSRIITVGIWMIINGLILWYLSRKKIKDQFLEAIFTEQLEKQKSIP